MERATDPSAEASVRLTRGSPRARPAPWRSGRAVVLVTVAALLVAAGCATSPAPAEPPPTASPVARLLDLSSIESVLSARGPVFTRQVALMAGDLTDAELERLVPAVTEGFAPALLRADVEAYVAADAPEGGVAEILSWYGSGPNAELRRLADAYEPETTLEEFARALTTERPSPERIRLTVQWAEVQGAGTFFVLLDQALTEAAHAVWRELRDDAPPFEPLADGALTQRLDASLNAAVVAFLYRYQTVPDDVLRAATGEFASPVGQWYVEAYSLGVADAIRSAGQRVVASLRGGAPQP